MERQITPEQLAANVRDALRHVSSGEILTIVDNGQAIATVVATQEQPWVIRHDPALRLSDFEPGPPLSTAHVDPVQMLIADRDDERSGKKYH